MFSIEIDKILSKRCIFENDLLIEEIYLTEFINECPQGNLLSPFIIGRGKRIRSILYFYFLNKFCPNIDEKVKYETIALIEALHFASIIHDDVVDNNLNRRNKESFLKKHGKKQSILIGDYVLIRALDKFLKLHDGNRIVQNLFIRECHSTAYGAILEQTMTNQSTISDYIRMASLKTSPFFKLSCFLGNYFGSQNFETSKKIAIFGICFGILFQVQNDIDCYKFESFEESEDYVQKNMTLPILIIRDYLGYDIKQFNEISKDGYNQIKILIFSEYFEKRLKMVLRKYINIANYELN